MNAGGVPNTCKSNGNLWIRLEGGVANWWRESAVPHTGTETRARLLREAAVGDIAQSAKAGCSDAAWAMKAFGL